MKILRNILFQHGNIVALLLGIVITLVSIIIGISTTFGIILISIGASFISSSLLALLTLSLIKRQNAAADIVAEWGLENIYETRAQMNESTNRNLEKNKKDLDIIAFGLKDFRAKKNALIEEKVKLGMNIRILVINPESDMLKQREKDENEVEGSIKKDILDLIKWVKNLEKLQTHDKQVQIKLYNTSIQDFLFRLDNAIYIGPYLYGLSGSQTISYEYSANSIGYKYYSSYFDDLWKKNDICTEVQ